MARSRNSEDERLDDANLERVIKYLEEPKATKKEACRILNISYNTSRLDKLIENYKAKKEADAKRRAEKRGKPATLEEVEYIIREYLSGATLDCISKLIYRGTQFIHTVLETYGVPRRQQGTQNYFNPELIPDEASRTEFSIGETVWSARYNSLAQIMAKDPKPHSLGNVYRIWLKDEFWKQYAYQPACELASLQHLRDKGISI